MLSRKKKISQLSQLITSRLGNIINRDYVLLGLPYYLNIGDILIWEGERHFLKNLGYKCLNRGYNYRARNKIKEDTLILLQGGGNFGDLWRFIHEDRIDIIRQYKNNPIIITPVTLWYENTDLLKQDAKELSSHPNLTICARDSVTYNILKRHFNNNIILVPDMAFYIETSMIEQHTHNECKGTLFLKRNDKELLSNLSFSPKNIQGGIDVHDWPTMEINPPYWLRYKKLCRYGNRLVHFNGLQILSKFIIKSSDWYFHNCCRKQLIHDGINFVSQYRNIFTTRLHVGILSILLDKEVTILDNSYGKNANFFNTWLKDTDGITLLKPKNITNH